MIFLTPDNQAATFNRQPHKKVYPHNGDFCLLGSKFVKLQKQHEHHCFVYTVAVLISSSKIKAINKVAFMCHHA